MNLLNFGPGVSPEALAGWTQLAETLGYHFVMISDHVAMTPDVVARYSGAVLRSVRHAGVAGARHHPRGARHHRGHPAVSPPAPHRAAHRQLDRLSGGRFIFGVGVGWARQEFEALGVPFERRGAMSSDYLAAIKTAWTSDPRVVYRARSSRSATCATGRPRSGRRTRRSGSAAAARPPCGAPCGSGMRGIRSASAFRRCATAGCRSCARSRSKKAGPFRPCVHGSASNITDTKRPGRSADRGRGEPRSDQGRPRGTRVRSGRHTSLLDTYTDDAEATRDHEKAWRMLALLAERVLDLRRETLR